MEYEIYKPVEVSESLYNKVRAKLAWAFATRVEDGKFFIKRMAGLSDKNVKDYVNSILKE